MKKLERWYLKLWELPEPPDLLGDALHLANVALVHVLLGLGLGIAIVVVVTSWAN